jgi:hypothetical protein
MNWSTPVDLYCERNDPSFWAEPVNALTNGMFLIAAALAFAQWRRAGSRDLASLALIVVTVMIAFGSFAFHTLATRGAALADIVPIAVFVYGYFLLAMRRFLRLALIPAFAIVAAFIAGSLVFSGALPRGFLNGSGGYLPALGAMAAVGWLKRATAPGQAILAAAGVFAVSLALRSIDLLVCPAVPVGTHFLWHSLNAVVLYILLRTAVLTGTADAGGIAWQFRRGGQTAGLR